ncbi:MAG: COX15/CtaA family protein [Planctomycetaceae bacterium]
MATSAESSAAAPVNWPAVVAWTLLTTTAVLLSFGALVTTYDAAMAVPDWPGTFGHNMLLFPFAEWFWGPWDLFLEHGHRLLGATVGMLTLLLAAIVFSGRSSPTLRWLVAAAVVLVVVQGALGGLRVILDDKTVAKVHACTGPLFFAVATAIASIASRRGRGADRAADRPSHDPALEVAAPPPPSWALGAAVPTVLLVAAYLQLVAGAQLRHADATLAPTTFRWMVILHLLGAAAVTVLAALAVVAWQPHEPPAARRWSRVILALVVCQSLLGAGAWVFTWGAPAWIQEAWPVAEAIRARSPRGAMVVTAHVLVGMAILGSAVAMALEWGGMERLERLVGAAPRGRSAPPRAAAGAVGRVA